MLLWLGENMGTILTGLAVLSLVTAIVLKIRRDQKKGGCAGCACGYGDRQDPFGCRSKSDEFRPL